MGAQGDSPEAVAEADKLGHDQGAVEQHRQRECRHHLRSAAPQLKSPDPAVLSAISQALCASGRLAHCSCRQGTHGGASGKICCVNQTSWRAAEAHMLQLLLHDLQV